MDRRAFLALAAAAGAAVTGCAPGSRTTPPVREKATIGLTYIPNVQFSPFYLAVDKQEFRSRELDVTLSHHGANEGLFDALVAGREDFVLAGGDELLQARANGADLVAVAGYYRSYPAEIIARSSAGIRAAADLRGKRVGVPGRYGESWFALLVALREAGLSLTDVQVVEIGYTAQAAMTADRVDAVIGFANNDAVAMRLAGVSIVEVPLARDVPLVSACLITSRRMTTDRPVVVRNVVAGMVAGIRAVVADPDQAVTATGTRQPAQDATAQRAASATLAATVPLLAGSDGAVNPTLDSARWASMGRFMTEAGLVPVPVDGTAAMTNDFVS